MKICFLTILSLGILVGWQLEGNAQGGVDLTKDSRGSYAVENRLPVPITVFVVSRDQEGQMLSATTVRLNANSRQIVGPLAGHVVRIEDWEVVNLVVPRQRLPTIFSRRLPAVAQLDPAKIKARLKELEISETDVGDEKIALAAAEADLWLEQRNDETETFRSDPLRMELERQAAAVDTSAAGSLRRQQIQNERSRNETIEDVANLAMAYSIAAEARLEVIEKEKELYKPLFDNAKKALVVLDQKMKNFKIEIEAGRTFLQNTYQALTALTNQAEVGPTNVEVLGEPRRLSDTPSGLKDLVELQVRAPERIGVLLCDVDFNSGANQKTFFRRLAHSDRWVARIYWPILADSAQFRLQVPGVAQPIKLAGSVSAGRPAMSRSFELAEKSMKAVIKKYKETSFRAEGADSIKTVPIP
jgi:hypothetical protein